MARIFIDGFESGSYDLWNSASGFSIQSSGAPSGTYCVSCPNGFLIKYFSAIPYVYVAYKVSMHGFTSASGFNFYNGTTFLGSLNYVQYPTFTWGTVIGTSSISLSIYTWYLFEIYYLPHLTNGTVTFKINGDTAINVSGIKTAPSTSNIDSIRLTSGSSINSYYDDVVFDNANWIGNTKIQAIVPTGAGTTSQQTAFINAHPSSLANGSGNLTGPYLNLRTIIKGTYITKSGSKIRVGFSAHPAVGSTVVGCSIGLRDGSTTNFSGTPTILTVNGSTSFSIGAGTFIYSDIVNFNLVAGNDYLVHFYLSGSTCYFGYSTSVSETSYYEQNADVNDTNSLSISGYSSFSTSRFIALGLFVEETSGTYNYSAVDETPPSDIDYIKTGSSQTDTYTMGNLLGSISAIKSVAAQTRNWRTGNGSYDRAQHVVRPASTDRLAAAKTSMFPISPISFQSIWELNPEDSAAWEESDVNGMEAGIKAVTA